MFRESVTTAVYCTCFVYFDRKKDRGIVADVNYRLRVITGRAYSLLTNCRGFWHVINEPCRSGPVGSLTETDFVKNVVGGACLGSGVGVGGLGVGGWDLVLNQNGVQQNLRAIWYSWKT